MEGTTKDMPSKSNKKPGKPPKIIYRETLASRLRQLKVNPLLSKEKILSEYNGNKPDLKKKQEELPDKTVNNSASVFQFSATPLQPMKDIRKNDKLSDNTIFKKPLKPVSSYAFGSSILSSKKPVCNTPTKHVAISTKTNTSYVRTPRPIASTGSKPTVLDTSNRSVKSVESTLAEAFSKTRISSAGNTPAKASRPIPSYTSWNIKDAGNTPAKPRPVSGVNTGNAKSDVAVFRNTPAKVTVPSHQVCTSNADDVSTADDAEENSTGLLPSAVAGSSRPTQRKLFTQPKVLVKKSGNGKSDQKSKDVPHIYNNKAFQQRMAALNKQSGATRQNMPQSHIKRLNQGTNGCKQKNSISKTESTNKNVTRNTMENPNKLRRSVSSVNMSVKPILKKCKSEPEDLNTTYDKDDKLLLSFPDESRTPQSLRKSVSFKTKHGTDIISPSVRLYTPEPAVLRESLEKWLEEKGKSIQCFRHLHCFGLQHSNVQHTTMNKQQRVVLGENRNIVTASLNNSGDATASDSDTSLLSPNNLEMSAPLNNSTPVSSPDCGYDLPETPKIGSMQSSGNAPCSMHCPPEEDKENYTPCQDKDICAERCLTDLLKLIQSGHPEDRCQQWLLAIRQHTPKVMDNPRYWECVAAFYTENKNIPKAVDSYSQAIVLGAEPEEISSALDRLIEAFGQDNVKKCVGKGRMSIDSNNIFKSTIIQFALLRKKTLSWGEKETSANAEEKVIMTPVRRSSRATNSPYKSPGKVFSSLPVDDENAENIIFKPNYMLEPNMI